MQSPGIPTLPSGQTGQVLCTQVSRAVIQLPCLGMTRMPTPISPKFLPEGLMVCRGWELLSAVCGAINQLPFPDIYMGNFHAQYWFALEMINSAYSSVSLNVAGLCSFQVFLPAPLVRWGQEPCLLLNRIVTQLPCLGCRDRQGSSISVSCLWIQIRQTCSMPTSLFYLTWFCRWLKPLVWITICALMVGTWSAKIWLRDVVSPSLLPSQPDSQLSKFTGSL